jgi:hypothetical protein
MECFPERIGPAIGDLPELPVILFDTLAEACPAVVRLDNKKIKRHAH